MQQLLKAINFATKKHAGQVRRTTGLPYMVHPLAVAELVSSIINSEELIIISVLHDTLEDTETSFEELKGLFGYRVALIVKELTTDGILCNQIGKEAYQCERLPKLSIAALFIKLADILCNYQDNMSEESKERTKRVIIVLKPIIEDYDSIYLSTLFNQLLTTMEI